MGLGELCGYAIRLQIVSVLQNVDSCRRSNFYIFAKTGRLINPNGPVLRICECKMIKEDLIAERIAIESYSEIIRYLSDNDPTSRRMMEDILANEEEHAEEMRTLLEAASP
jgi:hypothetical protein